MRKRLTALLFALVLVSTLVMIFPAAGGSNQSDQSDPVESLLQKLSDDISNRTKFPEGAFKNPNALEGQRKALLNKIKAVGNQVKAGANKGAINKLKNDLLDRIEGWILDSPARQDLIDTIWAIINILHGFPVARFTESAETVYTDEAITFDASDSYDPDGYIASYLWDFDDGTDATGMIVTHAYADDGIYTVTLTVTDDDGATDTATSTKTVLNRPPVAMFTESAESVLIGEVIYFDASESYDPDGVVDSYFWDFGDGTSDTGVTVDHAYLDDGVYTVTLRVADNDGATATAASTKIVLNRAPVASFTENATTVLTGEVIHFDASGSEDPDGSIVDYFWDFGDGTDATGVTVDHAYASSGTYTVTLNVTDDDGAFGFASSLKTVLPLPPLNQPPVAVFTESATTVFTDEIIEFDASASYDPDGTIEDYFWDFGDGTNDTDVAVDHAYAEGGNYTVTLTVTDDDGASSSASATVTVEAPAGWPLALLAAIGLGIAALTVTLLYALYRRRKRGRSAASSESI